MDIRIDPESVYRDRLAAALQGKTEVVLSCGRIDVLTDTHVYEVKHIRMWKQAMGQALVYASELSLLPAIALFGDQPETRQMESLMQAAMSLEIEVVWIGLRDAPTVLLHAHKRSEFMEPKDYQQVVEQYYEKCWYLLHQAALVADHCKIRYGQEIWTYDEWVALFH